MLSTLNITARVFSSDRQYLGRVAYFVISQETGNLAKFVVKKGFFQKEDKVVDLSSVKSITDDGKIVSLKITTREYLDLPALTIYEESKTYSADLQNSYPFRLHTRMVTYLPETVFTRDVVPGQNQDGEVAGRFMEGIKIYTDQFVVLGGKSLLNVIDKAKNGVLHTVKFNFSDGKIEAINLREGLSFFSTAEFQVPFKLANLSRLNNTTPQYY